MLVWDEFPDTFRKKRFQSDEAIKNESGQLTQRLRAKEKRGGKKNGAASSCSLLPLINEPSSSRIYLCNARRFIACLCTLEPSAAFPPLRSSSSSSRSQILEPSVTAQRRAIDDIHHPDAALRRRFRDVQKIRQRLYYRAFPIARGINHRRCKGIRGRSLYLNLLATASIRVGGRPQERRASRIHGDLHTMQSGERRHQSVLLLPLPPLPGDG